MFRGIFKSHKNPPKERNPLIDSIDNVEQYLWSELQLIQVRSFASLISIIKSVHVCG